MDRLFSQDEIVSIRAPFIEQGEHCAPSGLSLATAFQSAPHSSNRANVWSRALRPVGSCFNPRPIHRTGRTRLSGDHVQPLGVSIRAPFIEQGERRLNARAARAREFQSAPHSSNRANVRELALKWGHEGFNPRPIHRTGRTQSLKSATARRLRFNPRPIHRTGRTRPDRKPIKIHDVSIRAPFIEQGERHWPGCRRCCPVVSIRAPFIEQGELPENKFNLRRG